MRSVHVGRLLLAIGLLVGLAASIGLLTGFEPARLPPALLNLAAYKLTYVAAVGLLAAGAMAIRGARRAEARSADAARLAREARVLADAFETAPRERADGRPTARVVPGEDGRATRGRSRPEP